MVSAIYCYNVISVEGNSSFSTWCDGALERDVELGFNM